MQNAGVLKRLRGIRYHKRNPSKFLRKKQTLKGITRREQYEELAKLGRAPERRRRR